VGRFLSLVFGEERKIQPSGVCLIGATVIIAIIIFAHLVSFFIGHTIRKLI
jgi:hypothetical protein